MKLTKNMICLIVACVGVFALLFLPLMSVSANIMGMSQSESISFFDVIDGIFEEFCSIAWLLALIAGAGAAFFAFKKDRNTTFLASAAAAVLMLLSLITLPDAPMAQLEVSGGIGLWLSLIAFAATAAMTQIFANEWDAE